MVLVSCSARVSLSPPKPHPPNHRLLSFDFRLENMSFARMHVCDPVCVVVSVTSISSSRFSHLFHIPIRDPVACRTPSSTESPPFQYRSSPRPSLASTTSEVGLVLLFRACCRGVCLVDDSMPISMTADAESLSLFPSRHSEVTEVVSWEHVHHLT